MAQPANPQSVLESIKETDAEAEEIIGGASIQRRIVVPRL
jgi:hypothetical protein